MPNYENLLLHTEVRWLSKGKVVRRIFEMKYELKEYFIQRGKFNLAEIYIKEKHISRIAYLTDILSILNSLNLSLQGGNVIIVDSIEKLNAFGMELDLWLQKIKSKNLYMFPTLNKYMEEGTTDITFDEEFQSVIVEHLRSLKDELSHYFPEAVQISHSLIKDPFAVDVENVPENCQEEFIDLLNSDCAKTDFKSLSISQFWIKQQPMYPVLSEKVLRVIMPFPSTYMCETGFSSLLMIKSKSRNRLSVEDDLRCALSTTLPQIDKLVKEKQYQQSH